MYKFIGQVPKEAILTLAETWACGVLIVGTNIAAGTTNLPSPRTTTRRTPSIFDVDTVNKTTEDMIVRRER
jgi:hypothetical protein